MDALYTQIYRELMIFVIQDPRTIERANWLLWVAHNLERFADRVTNICERTIFIATGSRRFGQITPVTPLVNVLLPLTLTNPAKVEFPPPTTASCPAPVMLELPTALWSSITGVSSRKAATSS